VRTTACLFALLTAHAAHAQPGLAPTPPDAAPAPLPKAGLFGVGFSIDLLGLGAIQAITSYGHASGVDVQLALQWDLDSHWALRLPIEFGVGGLTSGAGYGELAIIPGAVYRFRDAAGQRWVPYLGGGLRLGSAGIGNLMINRPLVVACCHDWGSSHSGKPDPNVDAEASTGLDLWGGVEWTPTSWFAIQLAGAAGYEHMGGVSVLVLRELVSLRLAI
jgi:hypothetical protein